MQECPVKGVSLVPGVTEVARRMKNGWSIRVRGSFGLGNGTFRLGWEKGCQGCQETASVVYKWVSVRTSAKPLGD